MPAPHSAPPSVQGFSDAWGLFSDYTLTDEFREQLAEAVDEVRVGSAEALWDPPDVEIPAETTLDPATKDALQDGLRRVLKDDLGDTPLVIPGTIQWRRSPHAPGVLDATNVQMPFRLFDSRECPLHLGMMLTAGVRTAEHLHLGRAGVLYPDQRWVLVEGDRETTFTTWQEVAPATVHSPTARGTGTHLMYAGISWGGSVELAWPGGQVQRLLESVGLPVEALAQVLSVLPPDSAANTDRAQMAGLILGAAHMIQKREQFGDWSPWTRRDLRRIMTAATRLVDKPTQRHALLGALVPPMPRIDW